jgi:hypothetical protein
VLSDFHMGTGRDATGRWAPAEDFRWTDEFIAFLTAVSGEGNNAVDLVLNGDTFELLQGTCGGSDRDAGCTEAEALARLTQVLKAHDGEITALGQFARAGSNRVIFVPGDHDAALLFPNVGSRVVSALGAPSDRVEVARSGHWLSQDGRVYAEHGHQIGFNAHRFANWPSPFIQRSAGDQLSRPWGERLMLGLYDRYERQYSIVDNVAAAGNGLRYVPSPDETSATNVAPELLRYLLFTVSWQQFRMELDDGEVRPPTWDLTQVRAQGPSFLVSSLPDDDRLKPLAAKALADGGLTDLVKSLSDDEIVLLCDYRAAVRRSRRRLEPTLTQLAPRGPAPTECPRTPESRGTTFEYFWRSRDLTFQRHLDAAARQLPDPSRPIHVFVYGHTHLPDRNQSSANMISGGLLKIPMEGFSPVRGALTPIAINGGAWQRTITPIQLERLATERNVSVRDLLSSMKPEDLSPCYGFVQVSSTSGAPVPAVRYWRQAANDRWGFGATCGR